MGRIIGTIGAALAIVAVVTAAAANAPTWTSSASGREAPRIMLDPSADNTDVYAYTAPDAPGRLETTSAAAPSYVPSLLAGGKSFVGPADDPFFVDLGAVFDGINIDKPGRPVIGLGNQAGGTDDLTGSSSG